MTQRTNWKAMYNTAHSDLAQAEQHAEQQKERALRAERSVGTLTQQAARFEKALERIAAYSTHNDEGTPTFLYISRWDPDKQETVRRRVKYHELIAMLATVTAIASEARNA